MCSALVEDLTARARIRDAALEQFAVHGFARATIRGIAARASVSSGLLRHHFGSKEALREACDRYVLDAFRAFNERALAEEEAGDLGFAAGSRRALEPFQPYVARSIVEGSSTSGALFDELVAMTHRWLVRADALRDADDEPTVDTHVRAAVLTTMGLGTAVLAVQLGRTIGVEPFSQVADRQVALALLDIYSHPLLSKELAASAADGFTDE